MKKHSPDFWLFTLTIALLVIGIFLVFDASYARAGARGDSHFFLKRQFLFAVVGLLLMSAGMQIRYWKLRPKAIWFLAASIFGLFLVFVPGIGETVNGATRWIKLPGGFRLQPSEFAKLALVMYMAVFLSSVGRDIRDLKRGFLPALVPLLPVGVLVMIEPDMGTTIVLMLTAVIMIYMAGARRRHLAVLTGTGVILGSTMVFTSPYRTARVLSFLDPFKDYLGNGYQVCQSLIALGSGGMLGVGLCEGREKLFYLPAEHTDFIFAVLGEEMGLIGTFLLAGLFLAFGVLGFRIALRTKDRFGSLMAAGISAMICGQALLNMCVVTSMVPATGVPLPLVSYGGSSLAVNLLSVGILLGISRYPQPERGSV